ncbi:MAG: NAD(P)H-hydrate dehydratase [Nitrospirae bacterium]|nr:NAD(P)H-hydrate dehydratase [Nitrospirota bacterium]
MKLVTAAQMQELDRRTIEEAGVSGKVLMERAGTGATNAFEEFFRSFKEKRVLVVCGKGNNGGDGFVMSRLLLKNKAKVQTILLENPKGLKGDAKYMYQRYMKTAGSPSIVVLPSAKTLQRLLKNSDILIDAMLGTGISEPVKDVFQMTINAMNESGLPICALDLPSGIHAETGKILGAAIRANLTVTFGQPKLGLFLGPAIDHTGDIQVIDIGIPEVFVKETSSTSYLLTPSLMRPLQPVRTRNSHKGTCGHTGIIAGSPGKTGAAALAAQASLRTGAGLVTVATPAQAHSALESKLLEAMSLPFPDTKSGTLGLSALPSLCEFQKNRTSLAIGPGITTHPETVELIHAFLPHISKPCVLDADALNALAGHCDLLRLCPQPLILTPHPGEMARLSSPIPGKTINSDRLGIASGFAQLYGVIVILKGARTVIAHPNGHVAICPTGNPGMATAGSGDVLTGVLGSLLAQGLSAWDAAQLGVYLHGMAGDLAAEQVGHIGMIASDIIAHLPQAIQVLQATDPLCMRPTPFPSR